MALKRVDSELSSKERFEKWFCQRAALMVALTIGAIFLSLIMVILIEKSAGEREKFLERQLDLANRYAVIFNGVTLTRIEKQPVSAAMLKDYVQNAVLNYFVIDRNDFVSKENQSFPAVRTDSPNVFIPALIKAVPKVEKLSHFFTPKESSSAKAFYIYLKYLYGQALAGKLPDSIEVSGVKSSSFSSDGSKFTYSAKIGVNIYFVGLDGKLHQGSGEIDYLIKGHFELPSGKLDAVNPYGMIVDDMQFKYIQVPSNV